MRLISAAAKEWGAPPQSCSVADGYVVFTSRRKSFGELAEAAAALPKPENVQLKGRNEFRYIGKTQHAPGYAGQGRWQCAVRHRRPLAGHAVRRAGAAARARWQRQELQGRRRAGNAGRAPSAADVFRRRGDRRLMVAGEAGARCAADRVGAGQECEADECLDQRGPEICFERQGQGGAQGRRRGQRAEVRPTRRGDLRAADARARDAGAAELHRRVSRGRLPRLRADASSAARAERRQRRRRDCRPRKYSCTRRSSVAASVDGSRPTSFRRPSSARRLRASR